MTTTEIEVPMLEFTTTPATKARPTVTFMLDGREVTATAPKMAVWVRMWMASTSTNSAELARENLLFLHYALGNETSEWLRNREYDPNDSFDLGDMARLVGFLGEAFEPLLKDEFDAAAVAWNPNAQPANREQRRAATKAVTRKPAKKTAAVARKR